MSTLLKVGELARITGKTIRAIHYYEELGLVAPRERSKGGFRLYSPLTVERVRNINRLQNLGFTLEQIRVIADAFRDSRPSPEVNRLLADGLDQLDEKIRSLRELRKQMETTLKIMNDCGLCEAEEGLRCPECREEIRPAGSPVIIDRLLHG